MVGAPVKPTGPPPQPPQKPRPVMPQREAGSMPRRNGRPGPIIRIVISLIIVWHFAGVFLAALSIGDTSPLVMNVAQKPPMQWYLDALYLNQGHSFFAPNVGPGHVIHYELFDQNNRVLEDSTFPNKKVQWPRLLYHRHMMLADQSDVPAAEQRGKYLQAYARHLLRVNKDAQTARVQLYAHWPLPSELAIQGRPTGYQKFAQYLAQQGQSHRIDDQGFEMIAESVQRRSDLEPESQPENQSSNTNQQLNWQRDRANVARGWSGGPPR